MVREPAQLSNRSRERVVTDDHAAPAACHELGARDDGPIRLRERD
jgi:hypothetical protein